MDAKPLETQVDTSNEILDIGDGYILKLVQARQKGAKEICFYKTVFNKDTREEDLLTLRPFIPTFYNCVRLSNASYLKLENITWNMKEACVMDVKIGAITWDPDSSPEKILKHMNQYPPSQHLGFKLAGFMIYNEETEVSELYDKSYCIRLKSDMILNQGFCKYLHPVSTKKDIIQTFLSKLCQIEKWFLHQQRFKFISSSILFVYDNYKDSSESHRKCDVRMIDFAQVYPTDTIDTNYLHGLQTLIQYFAQLLHKQ